MKKLIVMIGAITLSPSYAMMDYVAQARKDLHNRLLTYKTEFQIFINFMDHIHDWETIDDKTAMKLRSLDSALRKIIVVHRSQKIQQHKIWKKKLCVTEFHENKILQIDTQGNWHSESKYTFYDFRNRIKFSVKPDHCFIGQEEWYLEPSSIVIGPSGNNMQGEIYYHKSKANQLYNIYITAVQFPLCSDGSISVSGIKPIQRLNTKTGIYDKEFCSLYARNADYTQFCSVEYIPRDLNKDKNIIVGGLGEHYVHEDHWYGAGTYDIQFHDDEISVFVRDGGFVAPCKDKNHPYHKVCIEYRFTHGGVHCNHYKHVVANIKPLKELLSLANFECLRDLQKYLITCPTTTSTTTTSDTYFAYPVHTITHHYKPTDAWPLELFERIIKTMQFLAAPNNDKWYNELAEKLNRHDVSNFVQVALLSGGDPTYYLDILGQRCLMQRCHDAVIFCNYAGALYYKQSHSSIPVNLRNPIEPVPAPPRCLKEDPVLHNWVNHITKSPVTLKDSLQYLKDHKKDALTLSPNELITLFKEEAKKYTQRTWDNHKMGAYWEFDTDGMRINIYDLQRERDHLIDTYLVQGRTSGNVTHIEYIPDMQPVVYIDGQCVAI